MRVGMKLGQSTLNDDERNKEAKTRLDNLDGCLESMNEKEQRFVSNMLERFEQYGDKTFVSVGQLFWLRDLDDRYGN